MPPARRPPVNGWSADVSVERWLPIAVCVLGACSAPPVRPAVARPRHVVVVTIDTLRADRLGCYGSRDVATPNIDRLAREGALALQADAPAPITRPSHVSIFTGLYPAQHGIRDNISRALRSDVPTMADMFKAAGFDTAGFVSSIVLSAQSGLGRGFDEFSDRFDAETSDEANFLEILERRGDVAVGEATRWLERHADRPTFMWVHVYDPHAPYEPPEPYASRYAERPYDGEVAWSDDLVGRIDAALTRLGIRDQSLVVVTSDHGEALGAHGELVHGFYLYEATLRVPLVLRGPGIAAGTQIPVVARSVDVLPTVLDLAGVAPITGKDRLAGRSLAPSMRDPRSTLVDEASFAESLTPRLHYGWSDLRSIRDGRWKFILAPKPELYDLARDPDEVHNTVEAEPARARALRAELERHVAIEGTGPTAPGEVPSELVEKLGALGYVSGGAPEPGGRGADPKDRIDEYKLLNALLHQGLRRLRDREYALAAGDFRQLTAHGIDSFEAHFYFGKALMGLGRWRDAAIELERAIPRLPGFAGTYLTLAECRLAVRDRPGAVDSLRQGTRAVPSDARLFRRLGELTRDAGDLHAASSYFREAIARDPEEPSQWNSLGMILGAGGELAEAERAFREAVRRDPREPRYTYNLGLTLLRLQRQAHAMAYFEKTLELDPRFKAAADRLAENRGRNETTSPRRGSSR
jgi:choline-sulfatase